MLTKIALEDFSILQQGANNVVNIVTDVRMKMNALNVFQVLALRELIYLELWQLIVHKFAAMGKDSNTNVMMEIWKMEMAAIQTVLFRRDGPVAEDLQHNHLDASYQHR